MTETFKYTDKILKKLTLTETLMNLNIPNKLDTGLDKSVAANNAKNAGNGWFKQVLGQAEDPGVSVSHSARMRSSEYTNKFSDMLFGSVKRTKVFLPDIIVSADNISEPQQESWNVPSKANYVFLFENDSVKEYHLSGEYFQLYGNTSAVCVNYKGAKAVVVCKGNYTNFMCNSTNTSYGETYEYIQHNSTALSNSIKQHALSMFSRQEDRDLINEIMAGGSVPPVIFNAVSLGIIDTANIPIKSKMAVTTTGKYVVTNSLSGKDRGIIDRAKQEGQLSNFSILPENVKRDIESKLEELNKDPGPYGTLLEPLKTAHDLSRKNPISTYTTIFKQCIFSANWIINDLNNTLEVGTKNTAIYFSSPSQEEIANVFQVLQHEPTFPFAIVRAFNEYTDFPLQIRCFAAKVDKSTLQYRPAKNVNKIIIVSAGFNNYIVSKAEDAGLTGPSGYVEILKTLPVSENSAQKANVENKEVVYTAISKMYAGNGKFNSGILFKYMPPLLRQDVDAGLILKTSLEDLSLSELPYLSMISDTDRAHPKLIDYKQRMEQAPLALFHPIKNGTLDTTYTKLGELESAEGINLQAAVTDKFISLSEIKDILSKELDSVTDMGSFLTVCNKFAAVVSNLSRGFWTVDGDSLVARELTSTTGKKLLGMYNVLSTGKLNDSGIPPNAGLLFGGLDLNSLTDANTFNLFRREAVAAVANTIGR